MAYRILILSVCVSETPLTEVTLALHSHILTLRNQGDRRIENHPFSVWKRCHRRAIHVRVVKGEVQMKANVLYTVIFGIKNLPISFASEAHQASLKVHTECSILDSSVYITV